MKIYCDEGRYFSVEAVNENGKVTCVFTINGKTGKLHFGTEYLETVEIITNELLNIMELMKNVRTNKNGFV